MGSVMSVEDKGQEGHVGQVNLSRSEVAAQALEKLGVGERVEVRLACRGLPSKDVTSKSDPMAVLFTSSASGQTQWRELGRTNVVANSAHPEFVRPVLAKRDAGATQPMRVVIYDVDRRAANVEKLALGSQDYVGEAEFLLSELMAAPGQALELPLLDLERGRQLPGSCVVVLKAEVMAAQDTRVVRLGLSATGLMKKDLISQSDPFLRALRKRPVGGEDDWVPVFKTEVRMNNRDPLWQTIEVDIRQLCAADEALPLKLQVWDFDTNGGHDLLGEAVTSLAQLRLLAAAPPTQRTLPLPPPPGAKPGKPAAQPAAIVLRQLMVRDGPTPSQQLFGCFQACCASE